MALALVWFRDDLRLDDNPALSAAVADGFDPVPVFVRDPDEADAPRGAASWWLRNALADLDASLRERGSRMVFLKGGAGESLRGLVGQTGICAVYWNRRHRPAAMAADKAMEDALRGAGIHVRTFAASLLREPSAVLHDGLPYKVFGPYHRLCGTLPVRSPVGPAPASLAPVAESIRGLDVEDLSICPRAAWSDRFTRSWVPTQAGLSALLHDLGPLIPGYAHFRDYPARAGTSRLSPYIRFGQIDVARLHELVTALPPCEGRECYIKELHWREFASHYLHHFPKMPTAPVEEKFSLFRWREDEVGLEAWKAGRTGYPIVDAGMRQLWKTGWMHNRVRMIAGSFLVKDLLVDWRRGQEWFMDTLVDADTASNALGWQWVSGCGPDAAPFFRVFNPVVQAKRFDPDGYYIRRHVPELAALPTRWIHAPWMAPDDVLREAGVQLGMDYPHPIVDHGMARERALETLLEMNAAR